MPAKVQIDIEGNTTKLANELKKLRADTKAVAWEMKELEDAGKKNTTAYRNFESQLLKSGAELKKLGRLSRGTSTEVKRSFYQIIEAGENLTTILYGAGFAFSKMVSQVKGVVMAAANVETMGIVVHQLGKNIGVTATEIDDYVESVKKMGITSIVANQTIAKMIQANVKLEYASKLARLSQDAAVIGQIDSSEALDRLIHGITTYNPLVIRSMGITVTFQEAMQRYAESVGKTTKELTDAERVQVAVNEVLRKGEQIAGSYETAMETSGKKIRSFARYTEEAKVKLGDVFLPVVNTGIDAMTKLTQTFIDSETPVQVFIGGLTLVGGNLVNIIPLVTLLSGDKGFKGLGTSMKRAFTGVSGMILGTVAALAALMIATKLAVDYVNSINKELKTTPKETEDLQQKRTGAFYYADKKTEGNFFSEKQLEDSKKIGKVEKENVKILKEKEVGIDGILEKLGDVGKQTGANNKSSEKGNEVQQEELNLLVLAGVELEKIQDSIDANLTNVGALIDLRKQEYDLLQKMEIIEFGISKRRQEQVDMSMQLAELQKLSNLTDVTRGKMTFTPAGLEGLAGTIQGLPEVLREITMLTEITDAAIISLGNSMSGMFTGFIKGGEDAMSAVKEAMKSIVSTVIDAMEAWLFAAQGGSFAKAISTFGVSLLTDIPWTIAGFAALEIARGIIGGLAKGGTAEGGTPYIVGEKGAELFVPGQTGTVVSNDNLMNMLSTQNQPVVNNYFRTEGDYVRILEDHMPSYEQRKLYKR